MGVGALVVLAVGGVVTKFYGLSPKSRPAAAMTAPSTPEEIARGKYLTHHVYACVACHSKVHEELPGEPYYEDKLGGGREFVAMPMGTLRAPNLTPDKKTGLGSWTDGEIVRAMREGVSKDGHALFPMMPYKTYATAMSDEDALAVVAYLRSLPPIENDVGRSEIKFPISMFIRAAPAPLAGPPPAEPSPSDTLARGNWLLSACSCGDCHDSVDERRQPLPGMHLAGGAPFTLGPKGTAYAANITSDPETGIGAWTDDEVLEALRHGVSKKKPGRALYGMPWPYYGGLTEVDQKAIVVALRKVPPIKHAVPDAQINP
jgi:hypothetical protein